jgi:predicted transcriptional regulator of viral defense system
MSNIAEKLLKLTGSGKTVYSTADLTLYFQNEKKNKLWVNISRMLKKGYLKHIRRGLYCLEKTEINKLELAGKLKKDSYISFETVLAQAGVIFQWYDEIFSVADRNSFLENEFGKFRYRRLPKKLLADKTGIVNKGNYFIATPERALCDKIYKDGLVYFDDVTGLDKEKLRAVAKIYGNKRVVKDIKKLIDD